MTPATVMLIGSGVLVAVMLASPWLWRGVYRVVGRVRGRA